MKPGEVKSGRSPERRRFAAKRFFLGVDAGGSKTHALVADDHGQALGFAEAGTGNPQSVGFAGLQRVLSQVVGQALSNASLDLADLSGAGFGLAGYDWPSQLPAHLEVIAALGLERTKLCPFEVVNDAVVGLLAGASQGWGVVLVAGTGNNCRGRDRQGREGRITGEGSRFGEYGGGGELVLSAIQAISYQWTRRGPPTAITQKFLALSGALDIADLIEGIDLGRYRPRAAWARRVVEAAWEGDPVAVQLLAFSGRELAESACAVIRQLDLQNESFEVVLAGSLFKSGEVLIAPLESTLHAFAPHARLVRLDAPPVVGGVLLGMEMAGVDGFSLRQQLIATTHAFIRSFEPDQGES